MSSISEKVTLKEASLKKIDPEIWQSKASSPSFCYSFKTVIMYSNTNNNISSGSTVYPFPPYNFPLSSSSSCYNNHPPLLHQEIVTGGGNYGLFHNDQPFSLLNNTFMAPAEAESSMLNQGGDYQQMHYGYGPNVYHPHIISKQVQVPVVTVKKDRHSKIFTAQGLRDRRVRLSINVAREFFDLQDLLGFDKASKTVEWLLTKARKDIIDLGKSQSINTTSFSSSSTSECNEVEADTNNKVSKEKRKRKRKEAAAAARELRSKARARARQRTSEKKCCSGSKKSSPRIFTQLNLFNELEPTDMNREPGSTLLSIYQAQERQSVAVKRKFKAPSASNYLDRNPAGLISGSTESFPDRCGHINIQFPNAISQNWDMNGSNFTCPSIYAITTNNPT